MNKDFLYQIIQKMRDHEKNDPLLKRGIEKDWVCVLHPQLYHLLMDHFRAQKIEDQLGMLSHMFSIEQVTGRKTYIEPAAPNDSIQYMTEIQYWATYGEASAARAKLFREVDEDDTQ